ncbi:olfactory receptor 9Q2-like [Ambystoma mexicanum]|uniref:olfactory receptor 9Q2-like n=1 Tax=Ambystoma mexicanum TaxID=8296 RepID=UPI0037E7B056
MQQMAAYNQTHGPSYQGWQMVYDRLSIAVLVLALSLALPTAAAWLYLLHRHHRLASKARFLFLLVTTLSQLVYFSSSLVRFSLHFIGKPVARILCALLLTLQNYAIALELGALAFMCLDRYVAICQPLTYESVFSLENIWKVLMLMFLLPLFLQLVLVLLQLFGAGGNPVAYVVCTNDCLDHSAWLTYTRVGLTISHLLPNMTIIVVSYVLVVREGVRSGAISPANRRAQSTLAYHLLQMALFLLPMVNYTFLSPLQRRGIIGEDVMTFGRIVAIMCFTAGQVISPIIHGLRSEEICSLLLRSLGKRRRVAAVQDL